MTAKVKSVLQVVSEAVETAAGYALVVVGIYAAVFVDITGNGSLWQSLHHVQELQELESPNGVRNIRVPARTEVEKSHEDRILAVFDEPKKDGMVEAVYQDQQVLAKRSLVAYTDTPADPQKTGKEWKRGIKGSLRSFTVYGKGEQTTSSTSSGVNLRAGAQTASPAPQHVASADGSPAAIGSAAAVTRPGISTRLSHGTLSGSDSSRNFR